MNHVDHRQLPGEAAMLVAGAKAQLEACRRGVKNARL
jgi:hypothetical protein